MPIRINLKELFPADAQEITVDKINFNFNKLLELGIGEQGIQGISGIQGAAGPIGIAGGPGVRGTTWFVDSAANPNTLVIPGLLAGDLYLNSTTFEVWQYDGNQWNLLFDLTQIINNYLAQTPSPFTRGFGYGSPDDDRFIVFNRRGQTAGDITADTQMGAIFPNNANNDLLLLNNFNEDVLVNLNIWSGALYLPTATDSYFNSLLAIYADHHLPSTDIRGRNHLELGSLYDVTGLGELKLTTVHQNLKMRTFRIKDPLYSGLDYYDLAQLSLDAAGIIPFAYRGTGLDNASNAVFEFATPCYYDPGGGGPIDSRRTSMYLGSKRALDYLGGVIGQIKTDGSLYTDDAGVIFGGGAVGLARKYYLTPFPENTGYLSVPNQVAVPPSYLMLDSIGEIQSIFLDSEVLQTGGSFIQLGTGSPIEKRTAPAAYQISNTYRGHAGIAVKGNTVYTVTGDPNVSSLSGVGANYWGYFGKFRIENPNQPINEYSANFGTPGVDYSRFDGAVSNSNPIPACVGAYGQDSQPVGTGASDMAIAGNYAYVVNSQLLSSPNVGGNPIKLRTYFQVLELDSPDLNYFGLRKISRLGYNALGNSTNVITVGGFGGTNDPGELIGAYRVAVRGTHALIGTNALHSPTSSWTNLGGNGYSGGVAAVNISDPTLPEIDASASTYFAGATYAPAASPKSAIMDMEVVGNTLFALTWQQTTVGVGNAQIIVDSYDLGGLNDPFPTMQWLGTTASPITTFTGATPYSNIVKRGAICGNEKYIFVGYSNIVRVINAGLPTRTTVPVCRNVYSTLQTFSLSFPVGYSNSQILDMKQMSNSLYVLAEAISGGVTDTFIFKFDVSYYSITTTRSVVQQSGTSTFATQISRTKLPVDLGTPFYYSRFEIVGKNIYAVANDSGATKRSLVALDLEGIYTGAAEIESLRTEQLDVTQNLTVGGDTILHNSLSVGTNALIGGNLASSGLISGMGAVPIATVVPWAGDTSIVFGPELIDNSSVPCLTTAWFSVGSQLQSDCASINGWQEKNGVLTHLSIFDSDSVDQTLTLTVGELYYIEFSLDSLLGGPLFDGGIRLCLGDAANSNVTQVYNTQGNYAIVLQHTDAVNPILRILPEGFRGDITIHSFKQVSSGVEFGPDILTNGAFTGNANGWTTAAGAAIPTFPATAGNWSYNAGTVQRTGAPAFIVPLIQSNIGLNNYSTYEVTISATVPAGSYQLIMGSGLNLIADPNFDSPPGAQWLAGASWTVGNGRASLNGVPLSNLIDPGVTVITNEDYVLEYEIVSYTTGNVTPYLGTINPGNSGTTRSSTGFFREVISRTVGAVDNLVFVGTGTLVIDNVRLYRRGEEDLANLSTPLVSGSGLRTFHFNPSTLTSQMADVFQVACTNDFTGTIDFITIREIRQAAPTPKGWLLCNGAAYSSTQYVELFRTIGTKYGTIGSNFRVPNLAHRVPVGVDVSSTLQLAERSGTARQDLTERQLPRHQHAIGNGTDNSTISDPGNHTHTFPSDDNADGSGNGGREPYSFGHLPNVLNITTSPNGAHIHTGITGDGHSNGLDGASHNNMQPYLVMNYIIFAGN